ncbi:MAG6090-like repeat-containing lipoprotein [Mycoplasmopsis agalactiae]|uniref:MAG6090-like repeat-containing lipoprotein n=1 Tax=Mycoplasmopsis agalactiae TaxID=2110 RepID=UPI001F3EE01F|nr:hypothetical protein [Mycoplasmopsis agalactiae]
MKKGLLLKGGLLAFASPLISSACFVANIDKGQKESRDEMFTRGGPARPGRQCGKVLSDNPTCSVINKIEIDNSAHKQVDSSKAFLTSAKLTGELFSDEYANMAKKAVDRYKKHGDKHAHESAKMSAELFSDSFGKAIEEVKARVYRDSTSGLDIDLHPTKAQLEAEEKRLSELVKKILEDNKENNEKSFEFREKWNSKFVNDISGLDIKDSQLLDPWWIAYKNKLEALSRKIDKEVNNVNDIRKEITKLIEQIQKIKPEIEIKKIENTSSILTGKLFDESDADKIKDAERRYAKELADKLKVYKNHRTKFANATAELFSNEWLSEIEKAKRDKEISSKIYNDSASGLDINIYWTKEDLNRWTNKVLKDNWDLNKGTLDKIKAADITGKIFDDTYTDAINEASERKARAEEAKEAAKAEAEIKLIDHKVSASDITGELFSDEHQKWVEKVKNNIKTIIYRDSKSGLDIDIHWTKEDLDRAVNKILKANLKLNLDKLNELKAANVIAKIFDDTYTDAIKEIERKARAEEAKEAAKIDKEIERINHKVSASDITGELFSIEHQKWVNKIKNNIKARIYRDSESGLDINIYPTREELDEMAKKILSKNLKDNKVAWLMGLAARDTGKIFDDTYTDSIKASLDRQRKKIEVQKTEAHKNESAKMTGELFGDSFGRAIESVKTKIYRDSASGLDINVYPTKDEIDEIIKKILDKNKKDNEIAWLSGLSARDTGKIFDDTYTDAIKRAKEHEQWLKQFKEPVVFDSISWDWFIKDPELDKYWLPKVRTYLKRKVLLQVNKDIDKKIANEIIKGLNNIIDNNSGILEIKDGNVWSVDKKWYSYLGGTHYIIPGFTLNHSISNVLRRYITTGGDKDNNHPTIGGFGVGQNGLFVSKLGAGVFSIQARIALKDGTYSNTIYNQIIDLSKYLK